MPEVRLMVTVGLGVLFLVAALTKFAAPARFRAGVRGYRLLPPRIVRPLTALVPVIELCFAVALLFGLMTRFALYGAAALLLVFCVAMALVIRTGRHPDCGCGVGGIRLVGAGLIARNATLALFAIFASAAPPRGLRDVVANRGPFAHGSGLAALLALVAALVAAQVVADGWRTARAIHDLTRAER